MQSNNEFMLLSLLNLYLRYIDINTENGTQMTGRNRAHKRKCVEAHRIGTQDGNTSNLAENAGTKILIHQQETSKLFDATSIEIGKDDNANNTLAAGTTEKSKSLYTRTPIITKSVRAGRKRKALGVNRKPRIRRWAVRPINRDWALAGFHRKVFSNIKNLDQEQFFAHTRMTQPIFDWLLSFIQTSLKKRRQRIGAEERLVITLNYLAYGTSMQSIAFKHKLGKSTVRQTILDTCDVLWNLLSPIYLSEPTTSQYVDIAEDFKSNYEIPNCVGAIDGKHVSIRVPAKKKHIPGDKDCSTMLLIGVCDAKCKFISVGVEIYDKENEELLNITPFGTAIISDQLALPSHKPLYPLSQPFPHYFVADSSFPLRRNIMCPFVESNLDTTKAIFNYKILRARSITENCFGILSARWKVLSTTIELLPESCKSIILACVVLHNYIMMNDEKQLYCPADFLDQEGPDGYVIEGVWRSELQNNDCRPLLSVTSDLKRSSFEAKNLRDTLASFFSNESISYEIEMS